MDQISMTQKFIGNRLGLSHDNVTAAAAFLQKANLIRFDFGNITVLDWLGVETRACECYGVVTAESDRLPPLSVALDR